MAKDSPPLACNEYGKNSDGSFEDYYIRECADTLVKAQQIRQDAKLSKLVMKELDKRYKALESVMCEDPEEESEVE